jgi:hypothetical protein
MSKIKYLALLAVAVMLISVMSVMSGKPPDMDPPDGNTHPVHQYAIPPIIDGVVQVDVTWPSQMYIGVMQVRDPPDNIDVAEVYMMFDDLTGYSRVDNLPLGFGPEDEQGYYFYIGIKPLPGFSIKAGDPGAWLRIDWDQDGYIDFRDNNGNSATKGPPPHYTTQFAYTANGVEWAIPYIDKLNGVCCSPFDIIVHVDIVFPENMCGRTDTATFPGERPDGPFQSTTICVGEKIEPEPPEPGDWGIRTIGFWKHQLRCALGINKGHQHVPTATLRYYLNQISSGSTIDELIDMDSSMVEALALLELRGKHPMYDRAVQQLLATWLNYVSGNEQWDSDGDDDIDADDEYLIDVIVWAENLLNDGDPTNDEEVKDKLDELNNSGDE